MDAELEKLACHGKTRHITREAASIEMKRMSNKSRISGRRLNVYKCGFCNGFHVGKGRGLAK
jgi:hypothetical protein